MKKKILLFIGLAATSLVWAQSSVIRQDKLQVGRGTATDKSIVFDKGSGAANPVLKWNNTDGALEFSNDGTNYLALGSGSGGGSGGFSVLKNGGFEAGIATGWSYSGATVTVASSGSNLLFETKSAVFDATANAEFLRSDLYDIPVGLQGRNCYVQMQYKGGDANLTLQVLDGSDVVQASKALIASTGTITDGINFVCPSSGQLRVRILASADAAAIAVDQVHLGEPTNLTNVSQAEVLLRAQRTGSDQSILSTSATPLQWNTATIDPYSGLNTSTGVYTAKKAQQIYVSVRVYLQGYNAAEANEIAVRKNGTATCRFTQIATAATEVNNTISGCLISVIVGDTIDVTSATVVEAGYLFDGDSSTNKSGFEILGLPSSSEIAVRPDKSGLTPWQSVTFTGSWNTNTTYTGYVRRVGDTAHFQVRLAMSGAPNSAALTLNLPSGYVVDTAKVFASGANENLGHVTIQDSGTAQFFGRVAYNSTTVVSIRAAGAASTYADLTNVTQAVPIALIANGDTFFVEFSVPIVGWDYTMPAPILVGSVTSNSAGAERVERLFGISDGSNCTVTSQSGSWISSGTRNGVGDCTWNIAAGIFSATPTCVTSVNSSDNSSTMQIDTTTPISATAVRTQRNTGGSPAEGTLFLICMGPR